MQTSPTTLLDLNKDQLSEVINSVRAKLQELGLDKLSLTFYKQLILNNETSKQGMIIINGLVSSALKEKVDALSVELKKILGVYGPDAYAVEVETGIGEGEKFPALSNLTFLPTKETKNFECGTGEVLLIDFWATWCGPCQRPMQHNQEMLEKNAEKWHGKARIVGISVDNAIEDVVKRVEERKWDKVEHYHAPGGFQSPAASQFGIQGIPCVFLVDKKGIIRYRGHPSSVNLEDKINELIAEEDNSAPAPTKVEESTLTTCSIHGCSESHTKKTPFISIDVDTEATKKFQEAHEANKHLIEKIAGLSFGIIGTRVFKSNEESFTGRVFMIGAITSQDKEAVLTYWRNVVQPLPKEFEVDNSIRINDILEVKYGTECATCKKVLEKGVAHYVCTTCQSKEKADHAFCVDCADKEFTKDINSAQELFHPHSLLLLHEDSEATMKSLKRVMNNSDLITDNHPNFAKAKAAKACDGIGCDSCGQYPVLNYRWACANCDDFDYCSNCMKASRDASNEKHKDVIEKGESKGHDKSHVFYRAHYLLVLQRVPGEPLELIPINKQ